MATVSESVRAFAAGFSIPQPRVYVDARTLREQDPTLLPRDPVGRNLSTSVLPPHLVNLMTGVAVGDPIAKVVQQVRAYRAAGYISPMAEVLGEIEAGPALLGRQSLGLDLDGLVDFLARPSAKEREMRLAWGGSFRVTLIVGGGMGAVVEDRTTSRLDCYSAERPNSPSGENTFWLYGKEYPVTPLQRIVHLEFEHFELAAALWADSLARGAVYTPSLLDPSGIEPETETAAQGPCRDQSAAAVSDQTADTVLDGASQPHPSCEREKSQPPRVSRPGRPRHPLKDAP